MAFTFLPRLVGRGVIVGSCVALCVLVATAGASASPPPTTINLCVNPGGNVTSRPTCLPNETLFVAVSSAAFNNLQTQVTNNAAKEATDVTALQAEITALQARATTDEGLIATLQTDESNDAAAITVLQNRATTDEGLISSLTTAEATDATNITTLQGDITTINTTLSTIVPIVNGIRTTINGVIDTINTVIITPLNTVICTLSLGADCSAIATISDI